MILAAGRGTRLHRLGQSTPKVLIDIGGAPLLERHLHYLEEQGIRRVVINTHHRAESIRQYVEHYRGQLEIILTYEEQLLGTAGGVRNALPYLEPGPFLVLYGDILIDQSVKSLLECHQEQNAQATLAVHEADSSVGKGVLEVDPSGRVTKFTEKATRSSGSALINSGIYILDTNLVAELRPGYRAILDTMCSQALWTVASRFSPFGSHVPLLTSAHPTASSLLACASRQGLRRAGVSHDDPHCFCCRLHER